MRHTLIYLLILCTPAFADSVGIYRNQEFYRDADANGAWNAGDLYQRFGPVGATPITGDWNGDGFDEIGVHVGYRFYLDMNGNGAWDEGDRMLAFGVIGDVPIVGDWNGDGVDEIGVQRGKRYYLDANGNGRWDIGDVQFSFGVDDDVPVVGDWNGDGIDEIGVWRQGRYYLDTNGNFRWDATDETFRFGKSTDVPIVGDWSGNGNSTVGVQRGNEFYLDLTGNYRWDGDLADKRFRFGIAGDLPLIGRWNGIPAPIPTLPNGYAPTPFEEGFQYADLSNQGFDTIRADARLSQFYTSTPINYDVAVQMADFLRSYFKHGVNSSPVDQPHVLDMLEQADEGETYLCENIAIMLAQMIQAGGRQARLIRLFNATGGGHVVLEMWAGEKWAVIDPDYNVHYLLNGIPMSAQELHETDPELVERVPGNSPNTLFTSESKLIERFYREGYGIYYYNRWIDADLPLTNPERKVEYATYYVGSSTYQRARFYHSTP